MYKQIQALSIGLALVLAPVLASGQSSYPSRPIRIIVPFAPGGASDVVARIIAPRLGEALAQQIVIENRPGASGNIGMEAAASAAPDGYTLYLGNIGTIAINPALFANLTVKPQRDFAPVTLVADVPSILIANPTVPGNTLAEFIAFARRNPGVINFASTGSGALSRMELEQFREVAKLNVVHIPYNGAGPAVTGILSGETHVMFVTLPSAIAHLQAGKLKAFGISTEKRIDALPDVPTMTEVGFPEMTRGAWQGIFVPAGTPVAIVNRLHSALLATLASPDIARQFASAGMWVATNRTPEELAAFVAAETTRWGKVVKESRATVD